MALTSQGSGYEIAYGAVLTVHVASAVAGFGMLGLSGLYGAWGRRLESPKDLHDLRQFFAPRNRIGRSLWLVPFAGGIALWLNRGAGALGQAWVLAATTCWAAAMAAAVSVVWPAEARIRPLVAELDAGSFAEITPGQRHRLAALCQPVVRAATACDLLFVIALGFMVLKPGS